MLHERRRKLIGWGEIQEVGLSSTAATMVFPVDKMP
jgi:hypothetical protein